ncbi:tetratricopeptide repeat protein [Desulfoferrobacter suflitae]|uniref:tetratricopeptide repeat protein n=1 Tax=Desulfoferrobacter suflitae TaxID=2865782 RepID=UPI002164A719|nr:tetratricopeptide repeat protein [Desulfoferrobacter suflitae]MCK8601160.1 tetratricopeptide repeat protein [Desulfoferrobacter suflitae]
MGTGAKIFQLMLVGLVSLSFWVPENLQAQAPRKDPQKVLYQAKQALDNRQYRRAIQIIEHYLKDSGTAGSPPAYEILGNAWYHEGNLDEAYRAFHKSFQLNPKSFESCSNLASVAYAMSNLEEAAGWYEKAHGISQEKSGELLYKASVSYSKAGKKTEARRVLQQILEEQEKMPQSWWQLLIHADIDLADWNAAAQHLVAYLDRYHTDAEDWKLLAKVAVNRKDYKTAAVALEIAHVLKGPERSAWKELANLYFALDIPLQAARCLVKAFGPNPSASQCDEMAGAYARAHRLAGAIDYARRAIELDPTSERYVEIGKLYYQAGRWQEAADALNAGLRLDAASGLAHLLSGYTALELDDLEAARSAFQKAAWDDACKARAQQAMRALDY